MSLVKEQGSVYWCVLEKERGRAKKDVNTKKNREKKNKKANLVTGSSPLTGGALGR
jgi:hypothetical protein